MLSFSDYLFSYSLLDKQVNVNSSFIYIKNPFTEINIILDSFRLFNYTPGSHHYLENFATIISL